MIVDCHTHISCAITGDESTPERLASEETVDKCIVLAAAEQSAQEVNKKLSEYVGKHEQKMIGFAFADPTKEKTGVKNLISNIIKLGLKGVVLYCSDCGFHPAHSRAMRFYESAAELGLPIFFHNAGHFGSASPLNYAQPYLLDEIAGKFSALKIVVGTMGMPFVEQTLSLVEKHENVYADLTIRPERIWQVYNTVVAAYERGVMDKLLFGSGFPLGAAGQCMETLLGFNKLLGDTNLPTVPRGNIQNIIQRNTLELLGVKDGG